MPSEAPRADEILFDVSEADIDEALAACDGDPRATIRALMVTQAFLEHEMSRRSSRGYARGVPFAKLFDAQG